MKVEPTLERPLKGLERAAGWVKYGVQLASDPGKPGKLGSLEFTFTISIHSGTSPDSVLVHSLGTIADGTLVLIAYR